VVPRTLRRHQASVAELRLAAAAELRLAAAAAAVEGDMQPPRGRLCPGPPDQALDLTLQCPSATSIPAAPTGDSELDPLIP
jgi:hypothetical protein